MKYKIVFDSSSNLLELNGVDYGTVPLHIIVGDKDFVDDKNVDINYMQEVLLSHKGKSSTSCPSTQEWLDAFSDADVVFCVTITSNLSGAYASAKIAEKMYKSNFPDKRVFVIDSLSTGPEMVLIIEKLIELINSIDNPEKIYDEICKYQENTHLYFSLSTLNNLAKNGRISPILAKGIGILGIKVVGKASDEGTLEPMDKCRGDKRAYNRLIAHMKKCGYKNGRVIISHTNNPSGADEMKELINNELGYLDTIIMENRALCSYYAEPGSILIGFES